MYVLKSSLPELHGFTPMRRKGFRAEEENIVLHRAVSVQFCCRQRQKKPKPCPLCTYTHVHTS